MKRTLRLVAATMLVAPAIGAPLFAQGDGGLTPGDVVRVERDFVGTVMAIEDDATLTLLGEGKPICWPGIGHGEAPRCDPAPSVRRVVDWRATTVERQVVDKSYTRRTIVGALLGAVASAPIGYLTGPSLGYGKIDACIEQGIIGGACSISTPRDQAEARQRSQDQKRGAVFFGAVGASIGAIIARRTVDEWVEIRPPARPADDGAWYLGVRLRLDGR